MRLRFAAGWLDREHSNNFTGFEMFHSRIPGLAFTDQSQVKPAVQRSGRVFWVCKRGFDLVLSLLFLPPLLVITALLFLLNPFFNRGPLFFTQARMGQGWVPFTAVKFRTMLPEEGARRGHDDPLETHRITPLGRFLRKSRVDELPQVFNVLRGEMSLIGPRPDVVEHAREYALLVPGYRDRHKVRPGISGLAQTEIGYAEGVEATRRKVRADLYYIEHAGFGLDGYVFVRTIQTVLGRRGL